MMVIIINQSEIKLYYIIWPFYLLNISVISIPWQFKPDISCCVWNILVRLFLKTFERNYKLHTQIKTLLNM
jgi:hypothetical protein